MEGSKKTENSYINLPFACRMCMLQMEHLSPEERESELMLFSGGRYKIPCNEKKNPTCPVKEFLGM